MQKFSVSKLLDSVTLELFTENFIKNIKCYTDDRCAKKSQSLLAELMF
jgi:hypothetical protein